MLILKSQHEKKVVELKGLITSLEKQLSEAKSLKELLTEVVNRTGIPQPKSGTLIFSGDGSVNWSAGCNIPERFAELVDDYYGGKVIRQTATKVVELDKDGKPTYHYTSRKPKGYNYILVRK